MKFSRVTAAVLMASLSSPLFAGAEQSRLSGLRTWVLDQGVTEIEMNERQFWNFAARSFQSR